MSTLQEIHAALQHDKAYQWSVENEHTNNMRMVLRAYKYPFTIDDCFAQIVYAREQARQATLTPDQPEVLHQDDSTQPLTLETIKSNVLAGNHVHWKTTGYEVQVHGKNKTQWLIVCLFNSDCIGLTHADGVTLNGNLDDFFLGG